MLMEPNTGPLLQHQHHSSPDPLFKASAPIPHPQVVILLMTIPYCCDAFGNCSQPQ